MPDSEANRALYKHALTAKEIALGGIASPVAAAQELLAALDKNSPNNLST